MIFQRFLQLSAVFSLFLGSIAYAQNAPANPEISTGKSQKSVVSGSKIMAVTAHPDATQAAYDILKKGGTAADAAIAAQMVLGLVEPQSSGIGGGAFVLYYDAKKQQVFTLDGREKAPSTAGTHLFIGDDGKPMGFYEAALGGRAVGAPGVLRMLENLHQWQGRIGWDELLYPAIKLSEEGFVVSKRLSQMLKEERARFGIDVKTKIYFYPDTTTPLQAGDIVRNPEYAITLRDIVENGVDTFYEGDIAREIVKKVQGSRSRGLLSLEDMRSYEVMERKSVCSNYRRYKICSMGQPSSGGLTLLMALGMLEKFDLKTMGKNNPKSWHVIAEASRLAFADRNKYIADNDFVKTPDEMLLQTDYLNQRARLIRDDVPLKEVNAGIPNGWDRLMKQASDKALKPPGTSHINIADAYGNIISMTSSIETAFGSHMMVGGFLLNNQLTDFSFKPEDKEGLTIANRVEGNKRPRSSMAPTIIFDPDGKPFMAIGSAGGSRIIGYVLQRIISVIDWDKDIQSALNMPNMVHRGKKLELESEAIDLAEPLKDIGHPVLVGKMNSGLTAIHFKNGKAIGAADPRRDGVAIGE